MQDKQMGSSSYLRINGRGDEFIEEYTQDLKQKLIYRHTYGEQFLEEKEHSYQHLHLFSCGIPRFQPRNTQFLELRTLSLGQFSSSQIITVWKAFNPQIESTCPTSKKSSSVPINKTKVHNHIISLKPLTKLLQLQNLTELSISMNPLLDPLTSLTQCDLGALKQLRLYKTGEGSNDLASIALCAKLNCYFIKELGVGEQLGPNFKIKQHLIRNLFRCSQ